MEKFSDCQPKLIILHIAYLEFLERTSNYRVMPRCDDCNSDAIDLSANPVPFGEYHHLVAHVSVKNDAQ